MANYLPYLLFNGGNKIKDGALWLWSNYLKDEEARKKVAGAVDGGKGIIEQGKGLYDKLMEYYQYLFLTKSLKNENTKKPARRSYIRRRIAKPTHAYRNKKKKYWSPSRNRRISYRYKPRKRGGHNARISTMGTLLFLDAMKKKDNNSGGLNQSTVEKQMNQSTGQMEAPKTN